MVKRGMLARVCALLTFMCLAIVAMAQSGPTVSTDKGDYAPGETVQISGSGWYPNQTVTLQVLHTDGRTGGDGHDPFTTTSDANGNISTTWTVEMDDALGSSFILNADCAPAGMDPQHADCLFTDKAGTTTTVASSSNPSTYGASVTFTFTVSSAPLSPAPTGTVDVAVDGTTVTTVNLTGVNSTTASATYTTNALTGGSHTIKGSYNGDSNYLKSNGSLTQTVNVANSSSTLVSSLNPSFQGNSVTFTATVTGISGAAVPSGTVTFKDGTTVLGSASLSGGSAGFSTSGLGAGNHTITAVYGGDGNYATSTSSSVTQVVNSKVNTTTALSSSLNPSNEGQSVTFTAAVSPVSGSVTPTGTVTFKDGSTTLGTGTLSGGTASYSTTTLSPGTHSITAVYGGDATNNGSTSNTVAQKVVGNTTMTVTSNINPSVFGQSVTFTATLSVSSGSPTGAVTFMDGTTTLGTGNLSGLTATFSTANLAVGAHSITAVYGGDTNYNGSTSAAISQVVNKDSSTSSVASSLNPSLQGQSVTFTATVAAVSPATGIPTGTVTFMDGAATLGTATLSSGTAGFSTTSLAIGNHSITAVYGGDAIFAPSSSSAVSQVVQDPSTSLALSSNHNPSTYGQSVTFTGMLQDANGSKLSGKTVTFSDGATVLGTGTTNNGGNANVSISTLTAGTHTITATYAGDSGLTGSSASLSQVVNKATATVTISNTTQTYDGNPKPVTVVTTPTGLATTVTYNGSSTVPTDAGTYAVVATINDPNYQGSASANLVVNKATATITLSGLTTTYNGNAQTITVTTNPPNLAVVNVTYNGSSTAPTNAGTYAVSATLNNIDYTGSATGTFTIKQATPTLTVNGGTFVYDGTAHPATGDVTGVNNEDLGAPTFAYTPGGSTAPTNAGTYAVQASFAGNTNYVSATGSASITINKADQTITFNALPDKHFGDGDETLSATSTSGLAVTFQASAPATLTGNTMSFPANGGTTALITVTASQAGDSNHNPATDVVQKFKLLENVKPTSTAAVQPTPNTAGWDKTAVVVTVTAADNDGGDGVKEIHYSVDGGTDTAVPGASATINLSADGTHNVLFHAVDNAGNVEAANTQTVKIDQTAPALTANPDRDPDVNGWYTAPVTITFSADDGSGSGVDSTTLTPPIQYTGPDSKSAMVAGDVSDIAGNATHQVFHFKYDATAPDILVTGLTGAVHESVVFDISASDHGSGSNITLQATLTKDGNPFWSWSGTDVAPAAPEQTISGQANDGHYHLDVTATDEAGHVSTQAYDFVIDNEAPVIEFFSTSPADGGIYNSPQTIQYSITDAFDNIASTVQTLLSMVAGSDIGPVNIASGVTVSQEGKHTVHVSATDELGHTADTSRTFMIDMTPPAINDAAISGALAPNPAWFESNVSVTLSASDPQIRTMPTPIDGSGVKEILYYATGAQPIGDSNNPTVAAGNTTTFVINTEGVTTITYWAIDNAGNVASAKTVTVRFDKTAPTFDPMSDITTVATKPEGADVTFTLPTPTDNVDPHPQIQATPGSGSTFGVGTTTVTVTATDAAGQTFSRTFNVTVNNPVPSLSSISPNEKTYLDPAFVMTVSGNNFMPSSVVKIDGVPMPTTFVSFTELQASVPASEMSAAGTKNVAVSTPAPGGGDSGTAVFTIDKRHQTITFDSISNKTYGDAPFSVNPTSDSGLPVSLGIVSGPATISGDQITITGAGTVVVSATQAGDSNYYPADEVDRTFTVAKATPQIAVNGGTFTFDGNPHPATGSLTGVNGDNLGDPTYVYTPGGSDAPVHAGTYQVTGSFAGNDNYTSVSANATIVINKAQATIALSNLTYTYDANPHSATATTTPNGLPGVTVTYNGSTTPPTNAGSYAVDASLNNPDWQATDATDTLVVNKANATVHITGGTFTYDGNPHGATATVTGVNNEDLGAVAITYAPGGSNAPVNAGDYTATGSFAGNDNYNPASADAAIKINKAPATISLTNLHYTYDGNGHAATATTNPTGLSGLTVTYNGGSDLPLHAGSYAVQATLDNPNYVADPVNDTLVIDKANPTVTVTGVHVTFDNNPHAATGSATGVNNENLGPLTFSYTPGGSAVPVHAGTYSVTGSFAGNGDYNPGSNTATVQIDKADQSISLPPIGGHTYGDSPVTLNATATSGLAVSYSVQSGPGTLAGNVLSITGAGTISVQVTQSGNGDYNAAPNATITVVVSKATPVVNMTGGTFTYDGNAHPASGTITGVNGDTMPAPVIAYSPNVASPKDAGTYTATGSFAGNANYNSATAQATITINKANLSATADSLTMILNGTMPTLTGTLAGAVPSDGISATYATTATPTSDVGTYTITPALVDPNNRLSNYNVSITNGTLTILYKGNSGVLQPLNQDGSSVNKQGSTIPVKFQVFDAKGAAVSTPGVVAGFRLTQIIVGTASTTVNDTPVSTTPDTSFRWDGTQWIFNLSTKNLAAGQTYVYRITLKDGSYIDFRFGLR